ncbi:unnamed protein product [Closterium sp. NIES-65]|nr:unnamed protein product [Closterium sp. NIES-65]
MSRTDMVHYVDVSGGWDAGECDWCFDRAVAYRAADALGEGVTSFLVHLHRDQSPAIPRAPPSRPTRAMLDFSWNVPVQRIRGQQGGLGGQQGRQGGQQGGMGGQQRRQGEQQGVSPREQLVWKCEKVPLLCVQAMLLEWMAEPRVGVLMDLGRIRSRLPAVLANRGSLGDSPTASAASASAAAPPTAAAWSLCWRCSSCWAAYRRAVSFAAFLVLVARWPRVDTVWKAHVNRYDAGLVYPALVAQLGAGRQVENDCFASVLVQVLGLKESADLKEGFGFFVQQLLSGGLEKTDAEGRSGVGEVASVFSKPEHRNLGVMLFARGRSASRNGVEEAVIEEARERLRQQGLQNGLAAGVNEGGATGEGLKAAAAAAPAAAAPAAGQSVRAGCSLGSSDSDGIRGLVSCYSGCTGSSGTFSSNLMPVNADPVIGLLTYRVARILQWLRIYGSDSISAKSCFKDSPRGKVLPMRHPLRDLPSLLVRFGAVLPPLDGGSRLAEWEEWPEGDEAAVKFPVDASARCFGLGRRNSSLGRKNRGHVQRSSRGSLRRKLPLKKRLHFRASAIPSRFVSLVPVVALIANFAYLPAAALLDCVLSVFPPHTEEFRRLLKRVGLAVPPTPVSVSLSSLSATRSRLLELMEDADFFRISFLLHTALLCSTSLLEQIRPEGQQSLLVGGECKVVWEEVQSWLMAVMLPVGGVGARGAACSGSQSRKEDLSARMEEVTEMYLSVHSSSSSSSSSSIFSKQTSKEGNEPDYLKAWPGGVNLFACLREMLLGEPCYRPAASAAYSIPSAASKHTAAVAPDVQGRVCGAAGCGTVEGGGVKLRICGACGKVAYCSRECQKAHWPSHKLTCPGRTSGKRSGKNSSKA